MRCWRARRCDDHFIDMSRSDVDREGEYDADDVRDVHAFPYSNRTTDNDDAVPAANAVDAHRGASRLGAAVAEHGA